MTERARSVNGLTRDNEQNLMTLGWMLSQPKALVVLRADM